MERTLYYASIGPIMWNDEEFITDSGDEFVGMRRVALATDSGMLAAELVLTPSESALLAIEGGIFYNSADKSVYVCTEGT